MIGRRIATVALVLAAAAAGVGVIALVAREDGAGIGASSAASGEGSAPTTPEPAPATSAAERPRGAAPLFAATCASCHGALGEGGSAPALAGSGLDAGRVRARIAAGAPGMPAGLLRGDQADAVAAYVARLAGGSTSTTVQVDTTATTDAKADAPPPVRPATALAARRARHRLEETDAQVERLVAEQRGAEASRAAGAIADARARCERIANGVAGAPPEDIDRSGKGFALGDPHGLVGRKGKGDVLRIRQRLEEVGADPTLDDALATRARTAAGEATRLAAVLERAADRAAECARGTSGAALAAPLRRAGALAAEASRRWTALAAEVDALAKELEAG